MKELLLFLVVVSTACATAHDPGLRVRFDVGLGVGSSFFFEIPYNMRTAVQQRWTLTERVPGPRASLILFCPADRAVCAYYDDNGYVTGLQVAVRQDEFTDAIYDWSVQGFYEWEPKPRSGPYVKYWAIQQFFVSEAYLQMTAEQRRKGYNDKKLLQEHSIWVNGFNGQIDRINDKRSEIAESIYTEQACILWMGRHYYYNMTAELPCAADTLYPWFPLVHNGEMVGTGLIIYGKLPIKEGQRNWFERPPRLAVQAIVPHGPQCLYELADSPGLITLHIYYIRRPWALNCLFQ